MVGLTIDNLIEAEVQGLREQYREPHSTPVIIAVDVESIVAVVVAVVVVVVVGVGNREVDESVVSVVDDDVVVVQT